MASTQQPATILPDGATVISGGKPQYTTLATGNASSDSSRPHSSDKHVEASMNATSHRSGDKDVHGKLEAHSADKNVEAKLDSHSSTGSGGEQKVDAKFEAHSTGSSASHKSEHKSSEHHCDSSKRHSKELNRAPSQELQGEKTPKDVNLEIDVHRDDDGRKKVDASFHFEGKRDHLDDDKDDDDKKGGSGGKGGDSDEKSGRGKQLVGKAAEKIGNKIQERAANKPEEPEIIEPRNAGTHQGGIGQKIVQKVKAKIGDAMQGAAVDMLARHPGDQPRDLEASIKHHMEQANRLEREAFVEEQIANDHNLRRAERKEASKRAEDAKYRAKVEVATAEAEKHVLESH
jgi:hypothetical protein